jgi:hypothetical protein
MERRRKGNLQRKNWKPRNGGGEKRANKEL